MEAIQDDGHLRSITPLPRKRRTTSLSSSRKGKASSTWCSSWKKVLTGHLIIKVCQLHHSLGVVDITGYVEFDGNRRFSAVRKMLSRAHWEPANGNCAHNRHYCTKPVPQCKCNHCDPPPIRKEGPWEHGVPAAERQGERVDLIKLRDAIKGGKRKRDLIEDDDILPIYAKHARFAEDLYKLYTRPRGNYFSF